MYGSVPVKSLNVHSYEMDTNDANLQPSDMQAGVTAYARGQKITGTGKSFEFAYYGSFETNDFMIIPSNINVIQLSSATHPMQDIIILKNMKDLDFSVEQVVSNIVVDGASYPVTVTSTSSEISIVCDQTVTLQVFFGKDNYV